MEFASSDIRFDVPLAEACSEDRQEFCANVPPGSARVIRCLQDRCAPCYSFMAVRKKVSSWAFKVLMLSCARWTEVLTGAHLSVA